ncbi:MAG TPA: triphosphoribosyl-dephospho-CoA synthase MdcB [Steroidobacteraceae bacterium]|nr:triphosphoribosyl-dephospho-CoA synthase MdcB [Steroidobacteraceae bacterium]
MNVRPDPAGNSVLALERAPSARELGQLARRSLELELFTWPKPGLVSHLDSGAHEDMDASLLQASAHSLEPFFTQLAAAGAAGAPLRVLREIGIAAERAMLEVTRGVNTHRGAIFGLGLLTAAAGRLALEGTLPARSLGERVSQVWGRSLRITAPSGSHGAYVFEHYGAGGARTEAASGFAHVYLIGLPALRRARRWGAGEEAARVQACFALIAAVADTNILYRAGPAGLEHAQAVARRFLIEGGVQRGDWRERAAQAHADFISRRLSPGGCADLLAMTLFVDAMEAHA